MATASRRFAKPKIKAPKKHGPEFSAEDTWLKLSKNIREIQKHNACNLSFEENHRFAYNMVLHKEGHVLYSGVNQLIADNLDTLAQEKIIPAFPSAAVDDPIQQSQAGELLLKALKNVWDDHISSIVMLGQILRYMDRVYTQTAGVPDTWANGLRIFLSHIIHPPIEDHLITAIVNQIQVERDGYVINRSAVKECVDVFLSLETMNSGVKVYQRDLEPVILRETKTFYSAEGTRLLTRCDAQEYLQRVEARFDSEKSRIHHYLSSSTEPALLTILKDTLLTPHLNTIMSMPNSGFDVMIDTGKISDLSRLYRLFLLVPEGMPSLKRGLKNSIVSRGQETNSVSLGIDTVDMEGDERKPGDPNPSKRKGNQRIVSLNAGVQPAVKWVQDVLDLKDRFDRVWKESFEQNREIETTLNEGFETFINQNNKSPEFISLFIDDHLKRGLKGKSDAEVEAILDKTITVFRFVSEKDIFERYYKGHLAKRLLQGRSISDDAERGMLAKLKVECGFQFTQKLEAMFHDMKLSEENMKAYRAYLERTTPPDIDISVIVMTSTYWPMSYPKTPCNMPAAMSRACKSYEIFYLSRYSGRRLTWHAALGNADVKVAFKNRTHELNVSTTALIILLLFEKLRDDEFLTYREIQDATSVEDAELHRHLQSLACAKFKILKKHPQGRDVKIDDSFSFNGDFTANMMKIKIGTISSKAENTEERKETRDRIDEERRHQIEACIVRIMKDRKHLSHNDLVNEVTRQLGSRFQPEPHIIKKRIEGLIEREYLQRCEDHKSYNYLA